MPGRSRKIRAGSARGLVPSAVFKTVERRWLRRRWWVRFPCASARPSAWRTAWEVGVRSSLALGERAPRNDSHALPDPEGRLAALAAPGGEDVSLRSPPGG